MTQAGEITPSMMKQWQNNFRDCVRENSHRRELYYILTTGVWRNNGTRFEMKLKPQDFVPPIMMLSTMLHSVDNKSGRIEEIYVLPIDAPVDPSIPLGPVDENLFKIAKHLPLIYN